MCDPISLTVAGTALAGTLGSTYLQKKEADKVADQRGEAIDAANKRAQAFAKPAEQRFSDVLKGFAPGQLPEQAGKLEAERTADANAAIDAAAEGQDAGILDASAPKEIRSQMAGELRKALAGGKEQAALAAKSAKFGDLLTAKGFDLGRSRSDLGMFADFAGGSTAGLDAELEGIQPNNTFADILGGLGQLGTAVAVSRTPSGPAAKGSRRTTGGRRIGNDGRLAGGV